jgi:hypothetical protein
MCGNVCLEWSRCKLAFCSLTRSTSSGGVRRTGLVGVDSRGNVHTADVNDTAGKLVGIIQGNSRRLEPSFDKSRRQRKRPPAVKPTACETFMLK